MAELRWLQSAAVSSPYLDAAAEIARLLVRLAKPAGVGMSWDGDELIGADSTSENIIHGPVGADLYSGTAGIAWFLAQYGQFVKAVPCYETAIGAMQGALAASAACLETRRLSLFSGATGIALAAVEVGDWLDASHIRQQGLSVAKQVADAVTSDAVAQESDLIGGLAGIVIGLLAIQRRCRSRLLLEACRAACEELIARARREAWGWSWPDRASTESAPALCGLAHGASGIGLALAEYGVRTKRSEFRAAAREAFRYELSWFSSERCAWADLREGSEESASHGEWPGWTSAWCHGALGIGLARLRCYELTQDRAALAEASAAIQGARPLVVQNGLGLRQQKYGDVSLCHGLSGVIELFLAAAEVTGVEDHRRAAERVGDLCLEIYRANGKCWTLGLRGAQKVPGLFLGLAGIGLTMLRLHEPAAFSSLALLRGAVDRSGRHYVKKSAAKHLLQHSEHL